jgi:hypothetical protein
MKYKIILSLIRSGIFLIMLCMSACGDKDEPVSVEPEPKKTSKEITSFEFDGFTDEVVRIDQANGKIQIFAAWQSNWSLQPSIRHSGVSVFPDPGEKQNFTNPVKYTITAEDGSKKDYLVVVSSAWLSVGDVTSAASVAILSGDSHFYKILHANESVRDGGKTIGLDIGQEDVRYPKRGSRYFGVSLIVPIVNNTFVTTHTFNTRRNYPYKFPQATSYLGTYTNTSGAGKFTPESGSITISGYDTTNKLVSGSFKNIKFLNNSFFEAYPHYLITGGFMNVPME